MSMESAKAFIEKIKTDRDFSKNVSECKDQEARMSFVKQSGFDFSVEDMEMLKAELSEEDLNSIAGGENDITCGILPPGYRIPG